MSSEYGTSGSTGSEGSLAGTGVARSTSVGAGSDACPAAYPPAVPRRARSSTAPTPRAPMRARVGGELRHGVIRGLGGAMTTSSDLFAQHRDRLDAAVAACASRGYHSAFDESPSPRVYGENAAAEGKAAFEAHLGQP